MSLAPTTDATFAQDIANGVSFVDFWAEWCGPCRVMLPRLEEIDQKMGGRVKVYKMNVDESPLTPRSFKIMSIPTMIVFKDGKPVEQLVGLQEVKDIVMILEKQLAK